MTSFLKNYPNIAYWTESCGWIEIEYDEFSQSFIRVLDEGGMQWESDHKIEWQGREMGVPLAQLKPIGVDSETRQAIEDWRYWVDMGYEF